MANILDKSERLKTEDNPGLYVMRIFHDYYNEISGLKPNDLKDEKSIKDLAKNYLSNVMCLMDFIDLKNRESIKQREKSSKLLEQVHDLKGQLEKKLSSVKTTNIKSIKKEGLVAELSVRYRYKSRTGIKIGESSDAANVFYSMWDKKLIGVQEQFNVLYLTRGNEIIGFRTISTGSLTSTIIDTNLIISLALQCRAAAIIISHNHPAGTMQASEADLNITKKIKEACELLDVGLLDHIILSPHGEYISFSDEGLL